MSTQILPGRWNAAPLFGVVMLLLAGCRTQAPSTEFPLVTPPDEEAMPYSKVQIGALVGVSETDARSRFYSRTSSTAGAGRVPRRPERPRRPPTNIRARPRPVKPDPGARPLQAHG